MSIVSKTGDAGMTALMYGRRVSKCHPRVEAYGAVDELNAALGFARATAEDGFIRDHLLAIQQDLVTLMGELAVAAEDRARYVKDGFATVAPELTGKLEKLIREIEARDIAGRGWTTPGTNLNSAALEVARTTCRRAERRVIALQEAGELDNPQIRIHLNRLSDLLWLLVRWVETQTRPPAA